MSERLRLEAEFRDKGVAEGLKKIGKELGHVRRTPGMEEAHKWIEGFNEKAKDFVKEGGGISGTMKGIGIGSLMAATSLGELIRSFKELGERSADMKEVARQTGLTIDQVNALQRAGAKLHIDPQQMSGALQHFADTMFDFRRHLGELYGELNQFNPDFARKLSFEKPEQQIEDIVQYLGQIKDPALQKRWTELVFGSGEISRLLTNGGRDFATSLEDAQEHAARITPALLDQQDKLHQSVLDFTDAWTDFQTEVAPGVFANLNKAMAEFRAVFKDIREAFDFFQKNKDHPFKAAADAAGGASEDWLLGQQKINKQRTAAGDAPWVDLPGLLLKWQRSIHGLPQDGQPAPAARQGLPEVRSEDGNALHRNDEMPLQAPSKSWFNGLFHKSSFTTFGGSNGGAVPFGLTDAIAQGTKIGTLAAFRELMQQRELEDGDNKGAPGLQNAAYETWETDAQGRKRSGPIGLPAPNGDGADAPAGLLDMIRKGETGTLGSESFKAITSQWKGFKPDPTKMSVDQVLAFQKMMKGEGVTDSAVGGFQINGATLEDFKNRMHLSGSETFDAGLQTRIAKEIYRSTGGDLGRLRGRWTSLNKQPDSAIRGALDADRGGGAASDAVDHAAKLLGMGSRQAAQALGSRMTPGEWCADFVNGALKSANVKGVNSSIANDFLGWGKEVMADLGHKGDVMVENRGRGPGSTGGHVGLYTGESRMRNGHQELRMLSGNHGNQVGYGWKRADQVHLRRQMNLSEAAKDAGAREQTFRHEGGARLDINLKGDGSVGRVRSRAHGMITAVNISRAPTMISTSA